MTPDEYEPVARMIAKSIGIEMMDISTYEASRLMYWPSCSIDDKEFVFRTNKNERGLIDVDGVLGLYKDWKNPDEWPKSKKEDKNIKKELKKLGNPAEKDGIVGAFCTVYDIHTAIEKFLSDVYEPSDNPNKYHHIGSSAGYSASIMNDGWHMHSFHATDPAYNKACNAFDLVRIHKFGHLDDKDIKEGTPINRFPSYIKMCEFAKKDAEVSKELNRKLFRIFTE